MSHMSGGELPQMQERHCTRGGWCPDPQNIAATPSHILLRRARISSLCTSGVPEEPWQCWQTLSWRASLVLQRAWEETQKVKRGCSAKAFSGHDGLKPNLPTLRFLDGLNCRFGGRFFQTIFMFNVCCYSLAKHLQIWLYWKTIMNIFEQFRFRNLKKYELKRLTSFEFNVFLMFSFGNWNW